MIELLTKAKNITIQNNGIWSASHHKEVFYPKDGHELCFSVEDTSYWFSHRNQVIHELVNTYSPNSILFDVGGGNGCVSFFLQCHGKEVILVEPMQWGTLNAKKRGVNHVVHAMIQDIGLDDGTLPSVGLFDVLEHIEDDRGFLKNIHSLLQNQGTLYLTVPAHSILWSNDDNCAKHFRRYSTNLLKKCLVDSGFDVQYCSYFFSILVPAIFIFRTLPSILGQQKDISTTTEHRDHACKNTLASRILNRFFKNELKRIKNQKTVLFGSSCIAVAKKR